jgi:CHASE2 domain-containing sensor protein
VSAEVPFWCLIGLTTACLVHIGWRVWSNAAVSPITAVGLLIGFVGVLASGLAWWMQGHPLPPKPTPAPARRCVVQQWEYQYDPHKGYVGGWVCTGWSEQ